VGPNLNNGLQKVGSALVHEAGVLRTYRALARIAEMHCPFNIFRTRLSIHMPKGSVGSRRLYPTLRLF